MKKVIIFLVLGVLGCISYFAFEPVFLYKLEQKPLPKLDHLQPHLTHQEPRQLNADSLLKNALLKLRAPSLSAAIAKDGELVWSNAIGYADIATQIPTTTITQFRIGSTSKAVTSVGLGLLLEKGSLSLDSKVQDFVPYARENLSQISLQQLASHTSGIRNYGYCFCFPIWESLSDDTYISVAESVEIFNGDPLLFEPGSSFSYSSYNYTLLSAMIEGAAKTDFLSFMDQEVFQPLGLEYTAADRMGENPATMAKFYELEAGHYKEVYPTNNSNKWAGGGLLSTPTDLANMGSSVLNNTFLSEQTRNLLIQPIALSNGEINEQKYALGWRNDTTEKMFQGSRKVQIVHHGGTANGSTSFLVLLPEYNIAVSVLMNRGGWSPDLSAFAFQLAEIFINPFELN